MLLLGPVLLRVSFLFSVVLLWASIFPVGLASSGSVGLPSPSGIEAYVDQAWRTLPSIGGGSLDLGGIEDMCRDPLGRIIAVDFRRILVIDRNMGEVGDMANSSQASMYSPWVGHPARVAADSQGRIYIADMKAKSVYVLNQDLELMGIVPLPNYPWILPSCVAVDSMDRVIVGVYDGSNSRIIVYSWKGSSNCTGRPENDLLKTGEFKYNPPDEPPYCGMPYDIAVDSKDRIIIAEGGTPSLPRRERVLVFDKDFKWVATLGSWGSEPGHFMAARSVAIGPSDIIMAAGGDDGWINFYFPNGTFAGQIGSYGHPLWRPKVFASTPDGKILARWSGALRRVVIDWSTLTAINTTANTRPNGAVPETPLLAFPTLIGLTLLLAKKTSPPAQKRSIAKAMTSRS